MPDTRTQRGPHPRDLRCFAPEAVPALRAAVGDLCWLLSRGYSNKAALKLVGDRYALRDRQRQALQRCAASEEDREHRLALQVDPSALAERPVLVDGYNVLLTVEAALSGGLVLLARDGALRDLAAMSRHYRRVQTTRPALERIGDYLESLRCCEVSWLLDRPISNSGRLKLVMQETAAEHRWPWRVELLANPDHHLQASRDVVATADSAVLDRCAGWLNLARLVVERSVPEAWLLEL